MAGISFYLGFVRPPRVLAWQSKAAFLVFLFMLAPLLVYVLLTQSQAVERLEELGFSAHPGTIEAVGVANGVGENPVWLFKVEDDGERVLDFYRKPGSHPGWELKTDSGNMLIFRQGGRRVTIAAGKRGGVTSLMFSHSREESL